MSYLICFLLAASGDIQAAVKRAADSCRVTMLYAEQEGPGASKSVPPGVPPVLAFRYMEGSNKHRFGDLDLMVDDAGH